MHDHDHQPPPHRYIWHNCANPKSDRFSDGDATERCPESDRFSNRDETERFPESDRFSNRDETERFRATLLASVSLIIRVK